MHPLRIALTRAAGGNDELASHLRAEGFATVECPLVLIEPLDGPPVHADEYDWLVLTSRVGVERLFERLEGELPRVAVVGPGTAAALRARGIEPALVARTSTQEGLVRDLPEEPGRILFAGAEGTRDVIVRRLGADFLPLYRTVPVRPDAFPAVDLVVLASASAARAFAALQVGTPCVSIGPVTTAEAERHGVAVAAEAQAHDLDGLVEAVKLAASRVGSSPS